MTQAPTFFATEADFRRWLDAHHQSADELLVGFWKKGAGRPSIDWPQARDKLYASAGSTASASRSARTATPSASRRGGGSVWSRVNIERFHALKAAGQMTPAGERAFEAGCEDGCHYSYESAPRELAPEEIERLRADRAAWVDWETRPPGYRKLVLHWITSAKKPETRARRLATLIEDSAAGRRIAGVDIGRKRKP